MPDVLDVPDHLDVLDVPDVLDWKKSRLADCLAAQTQRSCQVNFLLFCIVHPITAYF